MSPLKLMTYTWILMVPVLAVGMSITPVNSPLLLWTDLVVPLSLLVVCPSLCLFSFKVFSLIVFTNIPFVDTFEAIVTSPDGKQVPTKITQKEDGSCEVEYTPTVEGVHQVVLKRKGGLRSC